MTFEHFLKFKTKLYFFKFSTKLVSMDSPGPQQSGFDILRTPRTMRVCGGHFVIFFQTSTMWAST